MKTYIITSAVIRFKDKYLIAKRAKSKAVAPEKWEFISGFIEEKETAEENILKEMKEEVNLTGKIVKSVEPYSITEDNTRWVIIPFLIESDSTNFTLNLEDHSEIKWVSKEELNKYPDLTELPELKRRDIF